MLAASTIHLDGQVLSLASGVLLPLVVGLLTRVPASRRLQSLLNALLSAVAGAVTTAIQAKGNIVPQTYLLNIGIAWVSSIATYYGLWEPTGVAGAVKAKTPNL